MHFAHHLLSFIGRRYMFEESKGVLTTVLGVRRFSLGVSTLGADLAIHKGGDDAGKAQLILRYTLNTLPGVNLDSTLKSSP